MRRNTHELSRVRLYFVATADAAGKNEKSKQVSMLMPSSSSSETRDEKFKSQSFCSSSSSTDSPVCVYVHRSSNSRERTSHTASQHNAVLMQAHAACSLQPMYTARTHIHTHKQIHTVSAHECTRGDRLSLHLDVRMHTRTRAAPRISPPCAQTRCSVPRCRPPPAPCISEYADTQLLVRLYHRGSCSCFGCRFHVRCTTDTHTDILGRYTYASIAALAELIYTHE
ncbi:unnamed protein product [Trichogramma brassicae]|uniref:Uncharacterized protein n=1 Tax=Trichogramma brassicae TaxID=86971 RepID=A0A6H5IEI7_9HYME|nr:unnamed protein product [Trichogramma brassicae]